MIDLQGFLDWRGIEDVCEGCQGTGKKTYGSTATFWGGIGGAAMTTSVCDRCWGSGDINRPWKSWKLIHQEIQDRAPLYDKIKIAIWKLAKKFREHESLEIIKCAEEIEKLLERFNSKT